MPTRPRRPAAPTLLPCGPDARRAPPPPSRPRGAPAASSSAAARPGRRSPRHVAGWLEQAREVEARAATLKALKDAEKWVKGAAEELRAERFAPISERAIANWRELRQGSSVDLHEITLKKSGAAAGRTSTSAPTARARTRSA